MNRKKQSISLQLNLMSLNTFLRNSTDFYLKKVLRTEEEKLVISFFIDVVVRGTSTSNSALARINLDLHLKNQPQLTTSENIFLADQNLLQKGETNNLSLKFGFRKPAYFIQLKSQSDLAANSELIRLHNEFVWVSSLNGSVSSKPNLFKPFELFFFYCKQYKPDDYD